VSCFVIAVLVPAASTPAAVAAGAPGPPEVPAGDVGFVDARSVVEDGTARPPSEPVRLLIAAIVALAAVAVTPARRGGVPERSAPSLPPEVPRTLRLRGPPVAVR
jgi:hypothetical protein